ncbi:MAG: ABC transporter ATP-binding protein [bacterium]|nr:ABC transporter ATP-binding protein [bacterium]
MELILESQNINDYLKATSIIDFNNHSIKALSKTNLDNSENKTNFIKKTFEYVRDNIKHSADADLSEVTCKASEVLEKGHGICYAKAHLLAALLRANGILTGLCYQKLILDDIELNKFCLHGLNAVYIDSIKRWIRLDARGNKEGVNAQFSLEQEQLAFPARTNLGEQDYPIIYTAPVNSVVIALTKSKDCMELWQQLPESL